MTLMHIDLDLGPTRHLTVVHKIGGERTGFQGSVFVHVDYLPGGKITGIRFSEHRRDGSTLDKLLHAIGDELTDIILLLQNRESPIREANQ